MSNSRIALLGIVIIGLLLLPGCGDDQEKPKSSGEPVQQQSDPANKEVESVVQTKNYDIVYTITDKRYDGGVNYHVLIDPPNLKNSDFKNDIKQIVKKIVTEKGLKSSIDFFDTRESIELYYNSQTRVTTKQENEILAVHHVAAFSGDLETGLYRNTLAFFPETVRKDKTVGKYVDIMEFNP